MNSLLLYELEMHINKRIFDKACIDYETYTKMNNMIIKKINKIENK